MTSNDWTDDEYMDEYGQNFETDANYDENIEQTNVVVVDRNTNEVMAASYASVANQNISSKFTSDIRDSSQININQDEHEQNKQMNTVKPIFIKEFDVFGSATPPKQFWLTHVELYKSIGKTIKPQCIKGIQRLSKMWRIYLDNYDDRQKLLTQGVIIRDKRITPLAYNPRNSDYEIITRVRVQNVPLSADDGIIERAITLQDKKVITVNREKLRVDSKLTNCETGDRIVICVKFDKPLPRKMKIGKYLARVVHFGQPKPTDIFLCSKCLQHGHSIRNCPNDWACRKCKRSGHQVLECPDFYNKPNEEQISDSQETIPTDKHDTTISDTQQTLPPEHLDTQQTMPPEQHSDSELENDKQTQSQSILTTIREHGDEKEEDSEDKTKKGRKNKNKAKQDSENSDTQNKQQDSEVKDKKQQNKKDGSSAKQADMTKYITPNRKAGGRNQNRTPPSPPQRGVHKQQRV